MINKLLKNMSFEANRSHNAHNRSLTFAAFLQSNSLAADDDETNHSSNSDSHRPSNASSTDSSSSSYNDNSTSFSSTSHSNQTRNSDFEDDPDNGLIGTIVMQEGHVYSLAASFDLLFTGYESKNIHVCKDFKDFSRFKSKSGFVKAIVITGDNRVYTGHQDGKIRIWRVSKRYSRLGTLPTLKESLTAAIFRRRNVMNIRHHDAVSCLSLNENLGLLYSGSWDKTIKVWRLSDSKCLESIEAHDDAVNTVVVGFNDLLFTGSADGTLKVWKRELTKHVLVHVLMKQENAVTALAVNLTEAVIYGGLSNGSVNFWERRKYLTHGGTLHGHRMGVLCLISAGSLLLSGGEDSNICVWRRNGDGMHTCLSVLMDHEGPVKCLTAEEEDNGGENRDRRWIVYSGSLDKSVKVWRVKEYAS